MAAKQPAKTQTKRHGRASNPGQGITVRMYRVGFGDCFLMILPGPRHILVDCGVHAKGNIRLNGESLIDKAFENICAVTGKKLALVIATHAHQDHVSGFGKYAAEFGAFEIGEVWLPWTDDLSNPVARKWHEKKKALAQLLRAHLAVKRDGDAQAAVENAQPNPAAMEALRRGFGKAKVRFLKAGDNVEAPAGLTGLSARILGPPQEPAFISKMNPPANDHYLRMAAMAASGRGLHPFRDWEIEEKELASNWPRLDKRLKASLGKQLEFPARAVAFALDKLLNNTSIVALFTFRDKHLLFPGDAQYGDWICWYKQQGGAELLSDICFYKVAHHGSWNATPKGALQDMPEGEFGAMMSTQDTPWKSIPRPALVKALADRTKGKVVRSDSILVPVKTAPKGPELDPLPAGFDKGDESHDEYFVDYHIS